jgi:hypothetical protein
MTDIGKENRAYERFAKTNPITFQEIINLRNSAKFKKDAQIILIFSAYQNEIEQLFSTRNQDIMHKVGTTLNNIGGFEFMAYILDLLSTIISTKTNKLDFLSHTRIIEMAWSGIGDWQA